MSKQWLLTVLFVTMLTGCRRVGSWLCCSFRQVDCLEQIDLGRAQAYIRSINAYQQFEKVGSFSALLLAPDVRQLSVLLHGKRTGIDKDREKAALLRQEQSLQEYITIYLVTDSSVVLGNEQSKWALSLEVGGIIVQPKYIKAIELSPEYTVILGSHYNRFKTVYQVDFVIPKMEDRRLKNNIFTLWLRTVHHQISFKWYCSLTGQLLTYYDTEDDCTTSACLARYEG